MGDTIMKALPPYLTPVNILDPDANEQIKRAGELARAMVAFDMVCNEHGIFAWGVEEKNTYLEERRHRAGEACWHEITARPHNKET
jgi:hypothetical protein